MCVCAVCVFVHARGRAVGCRWSDMSKERETAVLMWCDTSCLSVTLCSLVVASGAELNAVYHYCQTQKLTLILDPPPPHQTHTNTHRDVAAVFSKPNVPMRAKRLVFVFELCLELSHIRRRLRTAFHFSLFCFCGTIQMFQEGLRAWTTLRTRDSLQPGPPLSSFCLTLSFLFLFLFSSLPPPLLSASLSLAGDQRSFIIGAAMAASLLTAPFKLQAPLLSINSALPQTSCGHWQAETVFMTLFVSKRKWGVLAHLYLQLLNHLHLDSALSSAAVI